jgi:hypothetical protein
MTSDLSEMRAQGRLPIGNGQAPGIEIGLGATGDEAGAGVEDTVLWTGATFGVSVGGKGFFAAIVFVGFLAALRAAGFLPAAFFFGATAMRFCVRLATFFAFTADFFAALRFAAARKGAARFDRAVFFAATGLRRELFLADLALRFAARFAADFLFVAIQSPPSVERGMLQNNT